MYKRQVLLLPRPIMYCEQNYKGKRLVGTKKDRKMKISRGQFVRGRERGWRRRRRKEEKTKKNENKEEKE